MDGKRGKREMEAVEEEADLSEYEVVRGEFFAHLYEPAFTFNRNRVYVNTACIRKLPDTEYIQILVNAADRKLIVRPCLESDRDSFRWCTASDRRRTPKQVSCRVFFAKIVSLMNWNPEYRYRMIGKLIHSGDGFLFLFDMNNAEAYVRTVNGDGTCTSSRTPSYPEEWKNRFGVPVPEHQEAMKADFFDGYTVFRIDDDKRPARRKPDLTESGDDEDGDDKDGRNGEAKAEPLPRSEEEQDPDTPRDACPSGQS